MRGERLEPLDGKIQYLGNLVFQAPKKEYDHLICIVIIVILLIIEFIIESYL